MKPQRPKIGPDQLLMSILMSMSLLIVMMCSGETTVRMTMKASRSCQACNQAWNVPRSQSYGISGVLDMKNGQWYAPGMNEDTQKTLWGLLDDFQADVNDICSDNVRDQSTFEVVLEIYKRISGLRDDIRAMEKADTPLKTAEVTLLTLNIHVDESLRAAGNSINPSVQGYFRAMRDVKATLESRWLPEGQPVMLGND